MMKQSPEMEERALRYLEDRNVRADQVMRVLRENFEMPSWQAEDVARRSVHGSDRYFASKRDAS